MPYHQCLSGKDDLIINHQFLYQLL